MTLFCCLAERLVPLESMGAICRYLVLIAIALPLIASCSPVNPSVPSAAEPLSEPATESAASDCRTVQHAAGEATICGQPEKIVVLSPYTLELLLALGLQPAGFADHAPFAGDTFANPAQQIPYLGERITQPPANVGTAYAPSIETILALKPDLIIGNAWLRETEPLTRIAPVLILEWDAVETNLRAIAQAVGQPEKAEALIAASEQKVTAARQDFDPVVAEQPTVLVLSSNDAREFQVLSSPDNLCSALPSDLGFQVLSADSERADAEAANSGRPLPISLEALPQFEQADSVVLLGSDAKALHEFDDLAQFEQNQTTALKAAWEKNAIAQSLAASKAGRVYYLPYYLCAGLPGPIGTELYLEALKEQLLAPD